MELTRSDGEAAPVLLVTLPGATEIRLAVEAELRRRERPLAHSPAAAGRLVLCGPLPSPTPDWLATLLSQLPTPDHLSVVSSPAEGVTKMSTGPVPTPATRDTDHAAHQQHAGHDDHDEHDDHAEQGEHLGHAGHDAQHGHGGHHDHASHHMEGMAEPGDDRDGLRLDRWHLSLGPGLTDWPGGLVLHLVTQGDVIQEATPDLIQHARPEAELPYWSAPWLRAARGDRVTYGAAARHRCAAHLDSLGRLLAVAGWYDPAARTRRSRDRVLTARDHDLGALAAELRALTRRVRRSRTLRWLTRGLGELSAARADACGITGPARTADGDVYARLRVWLDEVDRAAARFTDPEPLPPHALAGPRGTLGGRPPSAGLLEVLPELLAGQEFGCARLVLASLDPDTDELDPAERSVRPAHPAGARHG